MYIRIKTPPSWKPIFGQMAQNCQAIYTKWDESRVFPAPDEIDLKRISDYLTDMAYGFLLFYNSNRSNIQYIDKERLRPIVKIKRKIEPPLLYDTIFFPLVHRRSVKMA